MEGKRIRRRNSQRLNIMPSYLLCRRNDSNLGGRQRRHVQCLANMARRPVFRAARMMVEERTASSEVQQRQAAENRQRAPPTNSSYSI
jgi:hypothetical protein